ncbi:hypothetical protein ACH5RR_029556 [Cinchona calisaya]|uniref:Uncharacterized protein n=1 Tax=Cinchona calisaya TaxID=153742 RepID=A0ABD2YRZ1_9GENT
MPVRGITTTSIKFRGRTNRKPITTQKVEDARFSALRADWRSKIFRILHLSVIKAFLVQLILLQFQVLHQYFIRVITELQRTNLEPEETCCIGDQPILLPLLLQTAVWIMAVQGRIGPACLFSSKHDIWTCCYNHPESPCIIFRYRHAWAKTNGGNVGLLALHSFQQFKY